MKALIIGAGIGGLTTALELYSSGVDVSVFEMVPELREQGAGINLQPNAVKILAGLGLLETLTAVSVQPKKTSYYSEDGRHIYSETRGIYSGYKFPQLAIHRGKLLTTLKTAFCERVGKDKLYLGHEFIDYEEMPGKIIAKFQLNNSKEKWYSGDFLIGADGIGSKLRKILHPAEGKFHYKGYKMWRGVTVMKAPLDRKTILVCGNTKVFLVTYPIIKYEDMDLVNWVAFALDSDAGIIYKDLWNYQSSANRFAHNFKNWDLEFLSVNELFRKARTPILESPLVDRNPLSFWGRGNVTLLGDAAHPMYPIGANGATQAIIDGSVLKKYIVESNLPSEGFKAYEEERLPITSKIVLDNRVKNQLAIFKLIESNCSCKDKLSHACVSASEFIQLSQEYKKHTGTLIDQVNLDDF